MKKVQNQLVYMILISCLLNGLALGEEKFGKVQKMLEEYGDIITKAVLDGDHETILSFHTDDVILMPDLHPMIRGKKALREGYEENKRKGVKYHSYSATTQDIWQCGDQVFHRGTFGASISSNESAQPIAFYGSYFSIWERQKDESYKIKYMIWNLDYNPWEK